MTARETGGRAGGRAGDLTATAYERIEDLFVSMTLPPGGFVRTQDLQALVAIGRTPVHQAVRRLSAETLLEIRPRNGIRIAPIDLARERHLAVLRRDLTGFVFTAAMRNMTPDARARLQALRQRLAEGAASGAITVETFNEIDKAFDVLLIRTSGERFLERTLRPLHSFARRTGHLHLTRISDSDGLARTVALHLSMMDGLLAGAPGPARTSCDDLIAYSVKLIDELAAGIDPALLDAGRPARATAPTSAPGVGE